MMTPPPYRRGVPRRRDKIRTFPLAEISPQAKPRRPPARQHPEGAGQVGLVTEDAEPALGHPPRDRRVESGRRNRQEHATVDDAEVDRGLHVREHRRRRGRRVARQAQRPGKVVPPAGGQHTHGAAGVRQRRRDLVQRAVSAHGQDPVDTARRRRPRQLAGMPRAPSSPAAPRRHPAARSAPPPPAPSPPPGRGPPPGWLSRRRRAQASPTLIPWPAWRPALALRIFDV